MKESDEWIRVQFMIDKERTHFYIKESKVEDIRVKLEEVRQGFISPATWKDNNKAYYRDVSE